MTRRWRDLEASVQGCNYNPLLVDWCERSLPFARFSRNTRPQGVLLVTVSGGSRAERQLDGADLERFRAGELVVRRADLAGTNACAAFHPGRYVEQTLGAGLELLGIVPDGAADVRQDQVLPRKPPAAERPGGD